MMQTGVDTSSGVPERIETDRLVIRCWTEADAPLLREAIDGSLEHLRAWLPFAHDEPKSLDETRALLRGFAAKFRAGEDFTFGIFTRDESAVLGGCGLHPRIGPGGLEIGYWIRADQTQKGFATEAARALTKAGLGASGIDRIQIHCDPRNVPSRRVPERLGYTLVETLLGDTEMPDGRMADTLVYAFPGGEGWEFMRTSAQPVPTPPARPRGPAHTWRRFLAGLLVLPALAAGGCNGGPSEPLPEAETRILFIGNSLTAYNDLPGVVASIATALGFDVSTYGITGPNMALEDHYWSGVGTRIRELAPDLVVMQQGPSSLPENQLHLRAWADTLSRIAREVGAEPALLMVWPELDRFSAFSAVRESYLGAAEYVQGIFIPAGEALKRLHMTHPEITPYSADRFHPNETGTILAAMVIVGTLFDAPVSGLPAVIPAGGGGRKVELLPEEWPVVPQVAQEVLDVWGGGEGAAG